MTINHSFNGDILTITPEGRLDTTTSPELEAVVDANIETADSLIMDFSGIDYISSAGLRVLLSAFKKMSKKGGMKLVHVNEMIMEIFEVTGFTDILTIE